MLPVSLELIKSHVRADDFADDDQYLVQLAEAAVEHIVDETRRTLPELIASGGGRLPARLVQAVLLMVGHWYDRREGVGTSNLSEVPYTIGALVKPFTKLSE